MQGGCVAGGAGSHGGAQIKTCHRAWRLVCHKLLLPAPPPARSPVVETRVADSGSEEPPPPPGSRVAVALKWAANDDWKTSYSWKAPIADSVPVPEADAQAMQLALVERRAFQRAPRKAYRRYNARVMLTRHFRVSMADEVERMSEADAEHLAHLFLDSFSSDGRFYCNWLGTDPCDLLRTPGEAKEHMFEFALVGVQTDKVALVAIWDDWP